MKSYNEIVVLFNIPVIQGLIVKYCLDEIIGLGYKVTIADMSPCLEPLYNSKVSLNRATDKRFEIQVLQTKNEVKEFLKKKAGQAFFFPMFDCYYETRYAYCLLTKYDIEYGYVNNLISDMKIDSEFSGKNTVLVNRFAPAHLWHAFYNRIIRNIIPYKKAEFISFCGTVFEEANFSNSMCDKTTRRVHLYSFDYERLLRKQGYENGGREYCVFLDQYLPFHPDVTAHSNIKIQPEKYYEEINEIFDYIRSKYNLDIIIAAHPKADYRGRTQCFPGCKIENNRTPELVKNAKLVLAQYSTSVALAVMMRKPVVLLNTPEIAAVPYFNASVKTLEKLLHFLVVTKSEDLYDKDIFSLDESAYKLFAQNHIACVEANESLLWERIFEAGNIGYKN